MSIDRDEQLGRLTEEMQAVLAAGETVDVHALTARFEVDAADVEQVAVALQAVRFSLDEDLADPNALTPPELPADYEVGAEIGRGGMGIVYRAHQKSLDRDIAVKVLRPGDLMLGDAIARFEREARNLARLRHRHIVSVHEVGKAEGFVWFTMDLIEGQSLRQLITDRQMTTGRAVKLLRQVCSAMAYAHGKGVVHRDLKPANILVDGDDDAFVVDFGLARDLGATGDATLTGQLLGTPAYMSPEQAIGDRDRIGEAADVYALGAILYECLTGKAPFAGMPLAQLMHAVVEKEPTPLRRLNPRVSTDLAVICEKAMQKRPEDRYATMQALAEDLERFTIGKEILARRRSGVARMVRLAGRQRRALLTAVVPIAVLAVVAWWFVVPDLLRRHRIEIGDQLLAEGNEDGALLAYQDALASEGEPDADLGLHTRMARCMINKAGRLLFRDQDEEAQELITRAKELLAPHAAANIRHHSQTPSQHELTAYRDAYYEWQKCSAIAGDGSMTGLLPDHLLVRLRRDLDGPGRDAALLFLAKALHFRGAAWERLGDRRREILVDLIRRRSQLPPELRQGLDVDFRRGGLRGVTLEYRDPRLEADLVEIVRDKTLDFDTRKNAAALFQHLGSFPFAIDLATRIGPSQIRTEILIEEADLQALVAGWDNVRALDGFAAYKARVASVGESLFRQRAPVEGKELNGWYLRNWLQQHTGFRGREAATWREWWQEHRDEDPRRWLLAALQWQTDPSALTPSTLVARFRATEARSSAYATAWIHCLLELTVDDGTRVPHLTAFTHELPVLWEKSLNTIPDARHLLRLAVITFVNGSPTPQLIWQRQVELGIDEAAQWQEWISPRIGLRSLHVGFERPWIARLQGTHFCSISASLRWTRDGIGGSAGGDVSPTAFGANVSGSYAGSSNVLHEGEVNLIGAGYDYPTDGRFYLDTIAVAFLDTADTPAQAWDIEAWRRATGETLERAATSRDAMVTRAELSILTNFLPLPEHREALRRIDRELNGQSDRFAEDRRRGLLLAGDASALDIAPGPTWLESVQTRSGPESYWVRLALSTDVPAIRDHAFAQLRDIDPSPAFARTLKRAAAEGLPLPEWLAERIRDTPDQVSQFLAESRGKITGLALLALATIASFVGTLRKRGTPWNRRFAIALWCLSLVLSRCSVWIDGTEYNPLWLGHGLNVLASWAVCWRLVHGTGWVLAPLWWTAATVLHLLDRMPRDYEPLVWATGVALFALLASHRSRLATRLRNRRVTLTEAS